MANPSCALDALGQTGFSLLDEARQCACIVGLVGVGLLGYAWIRPFLPVETCESEPSLPERCDSSFRRDARVPRGGWAGAFLVEFFKGRVHYEA